MKTIHQSEHDSQLSESDEHFRLFDYMIEGCQVIGFDWKYIYLNRSAEVHNRRPNKELIGQYYQEMWPGIEETEVYRIIRQALEEKTSFHFENSFFFPDGSPGWLDLSIQPVPEGVLIISIDITERKMTENSLRESEEKFRNLFSNNPQPMWIYDLETLFFLEVNDAAINHYGYTREEFLSMTLKDIRPKEDIEALLKDVEQTRKTYNPAGEWRHLKKNGELIIVEIISHTIMFDNRKARHVIVNDITMRKRAEEKFNESEEYFKILFESISDAILVAQLNDDQSFNYINVNDIACKLYGYAKEEFLTKTPDDIISENGKKDLKQRIHKLLNNNITVYETEHVKRDGQNFPVEISTRNTQIQNKTIFIAIVRDITELKQSEKALNAKHELFRTTFNISPLAAVLTKLPGRTIVEVNPAFETLFGYSGTELLGKSISEFDLWADSFEREKVVQMLFKKGKVQDIDFVFKTKSGRTGHGIFYSEVVEQVDEKYVLTKVMDVTERTQAEEKLKENEERFRQIFETANVGKSITLTTGEINVNKAFCDMLGYSKKELENKKWQEITPLEEVESIQQKLEPLLNGTSNSARFEKRYLHKNGSLIWADVSVVIHRDAEQKAPFLITTIVDINERKLAEQNLQESQELFSNAFLVGPVGMTITHISDGKFKNANESFCKMFEFDLSEVIGHTSTELNMWTKDERNKIIKQQIESGGLTNFELLAHTKSGKPINLLFSSKEMLIKGETCHLTTFMDITYRKESEENLRHLYDELEQRINERTKELTDLYNNAPCGYHSLDKNGVIVNINDTELQMLGYEREEMQRCMKIVDIMTPTSKEKFEATYPTFMQQGYLINNEFDFIKKDGTIIPILLSATAVFDSNNKYLMSRSTMIDNTSLKQAKEEILNAKATLEIANKELESFSYSVSHDLRTPLRHINGFAEILTKQYSDQLPEDAKKHLNTITGSARKMGTLIDDLLSFSRTGRVELKKSSLKMNQVIEDALVQIRPSIMDRKIEWKISSLPEVNGDYNLLRMAWINLLDNAVKYTRNKENAVIQIGFKNENKEIVFYIQDNGVGFDMKYADKLFGVFQRLHSSSQFDGTGIGLANVQRIILRHGGRTWAEAETDKGATFYFSIPKETEDKS